jgi:hypothetical protein
MFKRMLAVALLATAVGLGVTIGYVRVPPAAAVPAFARQYDLQCNACHTRPPRLNSFGEQFHMMGFQIPSAARPDGLVGSLAEDGPVKTLIDSLALRVEGGLFEAITSPRETRTEFMPPDEITLFIARPLLPELSVFVEIEGQPNAVEFENSRYVTRGTFGLGNEAFFMLNLGRLFGVLGAPTMEMGGQTMVGEHGGFQMHGPMLMAGKIDPNTNFSYATNRQLIASTDLEVKHGAVERFPIVPYAFASKFFGLFKNRDGREPQLVTDQVMYNTPGAPGADFHAMVNNIFVGEVGFLSENEGFDTYAMLRFDILDRQQFTFNVSALVNWGFGVVRAPDPEDLSRPGASRLDRLRYGLAANARWKTLDVYGAVIWDQLYGVPAGLRGVFDGTATGLTIQADYLVHEKLILSSRFDQLWAGGLKDERRDGSVLSLQAKFYPWQNIAFFARDSVNLQSVVERSPLRNWRNQLFVGIDWDF